MYHAIASILAYAAGLMLAADVRAFGVESRFILFSLYSVYVLYALWRSSDKIPQDLLYHRFADQRYCCCVPNVANVLSNLPFLAVGMIGLLTATTLERHRVIFCLGSILTAAGSAYYHWRPNNQTLVWDRLPMTLCTTSIFLTLLELASPRGLRWWWILYPLGLWSVIYWKQYDDLRLYAFIQYFPIAVLPLLFAWFPTTQDLTALYHAIFWYLTARAADALDHQIYRLTLHWMSGHTLKHLLAAWSMYYLLGMD